MLFGDCSDHKAESKAGDTALSVQGIWLRNNSPEENSFRKFCKSHEKAFQPQKKKKKTIRNLNTFFSLHLKFLSEKAIPQQSFGLKCTGDSLNTPLHFAIANALV